MDENENAATSLGSDRRMWFVGAAIAVLIAIMAVAVALTSTQQETEYPVGSAEAALQTYAEAWERGAIDTAYEMLTERVQARVEPLEFRHAMSWDEDAPTRIWIEERTDIDDGVVLKVSVETTFNGLFGPDRDTHSIRVTLVEVDGVWRIDTPLVGFYPW
jgi:hypothetical protein